MTETKQDQPAAEEPQFEVRRHWKSRDENVIRCYASMKGRVTINELIQYFAASHPHIRFLEGVELNFGTAVWDDEPTQDELDQRARQIEGAKRRHEEWERQTYERLKVKFEGSEVSR